MLSAGEPIFISVSRIQSSIFQITIALTLPSLIVEFEFVGMRVEVYRDYFGRWIKTNLTKIAKDDWSDLWAYGGEFGDIVGLTPFDVRASVKHNHPTHP